MDENIKDLINIPDGLDNAILKGFEEGKKKNKYKNRINIIKKGMTVAVVAVASIAVIGVANPQIVSAIPIVNKVFSYFDSSRFGYSIDKYEDLGEVINKTINKGGTKVTLDQIVVDDNTFIASLTVESDALRGFKDKKNPGDFFYPNYNLIINGETPTYYGATATIISDTKGAVVLEADISNMNLENDLKIDLDIRNIERSGKIIANGNWEYNIKTINGIGSESYVGDRKIEVNGGEIWVESLVKTPITSRVTINGKYENGTNESYELDKSNYIVRDNNGNELITESVGGYSDMEGNYQEKINILSDLSNVEYIEILQFEGNRKICKDIDGIQRELFICMDDSTEGINKKEEIISRKPTQEELDRGYALDSVQYYLNIDRSKAFMTIDELKGKIIKVNSNDEINITNIEANDKETKISMKIEGAYDYKDLSSLVIFDEDMNDIAAWEGHKGAILENPETKEVSITFGPIDKNKKYTIGIPMTKEVKYNEENKIVVNLK